jgi:hypothetical protein
LVTGAVMVAKWAVLPASVRNSNVWLGITEGGTYGASVVR